MESTAPTSVRAASRLRPTDARYWHLDGEHLTRSCRFRPPTGGRILGHHQKQGPPVHTSQHAGETATIEIDCLQYLTTLAHAHATLSGDVCVPDGVFGIEAYTVWVAVTQICPHPTVGQEATSFDVEGSQSVAVGLGEDQRRVVWGHDHAIGESASLCYLPN